MFVAPRPNSADDPWFAVRLALATTLAYALGLWLRPTMPMIAPALTAGIVAGMRGRFDPLKAVGGPVTMAVVMSAMALLVSLLRDFPLVMIVVVGAIYTASYTLILRTGNPMGMLILVASALMSIMGMNSVPGMAYLRDVFIEGSAVALGVIPLVYAVLPPATREKAVEVYPVGSGGRFWLRGAIRGAVLLLLTGWLYTIVNESNMMMAVAAIFVMVFPTRERLWSEARQRIHATVLGGAVALAILAGATFNAHLPNLLALIFLGALLLAHRMVVGRQPPMVYQYALSAMVAVVGAALSAKAPIDTVLLRIGLTMGGAIAAAMLTGLLESVFLAPDAPPPPGAVALNGVQ